MTKLTRLTPVQQAPGAALAAPDPACYETLVGRLSLLHRSLQAIAILSIAVACGSEEADPGHTEHPHEVACEGRGEQFSAGMSKSNASMKVTLVKSEIVPPAIGENPWTLQVADPNGSPIAGAIIIASAKMPDHSHPPTSKVAEESEPGVYKVSPDLSMPGYWEVTLEVTPSGGSVSSVMFAFCVAQD